MHYDLGLANHHADLCISKIRWLPLQLRETLQKDGLWEDLIQEMYAAAFFAWKQGMDSEETRRYAAKRLYAFFKAYGFRPYRQGYYRFEKSLFSRYDLNKGIPDKDIMPAPFRFGHDHFADRILVLLSKHPEGLPRRKVCMYFQISMDEANAYVAQLIRQGLVLEIERENIRGRPLTPLLIAPEPSQALPEPEMIRSREADRIRQAYFAEGKSIKWIAREFHHCRKTVRKVVRAERTKRERKAA